METENKEIILSDIFDGSVLDLIKLEGLDVKVQAEIFSNVLRELYDDKKVEKDKTLIRKNSLKCLKLSCDPESHIVHLPYRLIVKKTDNKMFFNFEDRTKQNLTLFIIILGFFIFAAAGATYAGLKYIRVKDLNKDIDGDGIADINIDTNLDEKADINVDTNSDDKPELNIDYKGNRIPMFNIDTDFDEKPDVNITNVDKNGDGKCDVNCDTNDDGWPDLFLDLDGDGKADMYIDTDGDGKADLNFDMDGDNACDLHCDTNDDLKCDKYCLENVEDKPDEENNGSTATVGDNTADITTAEFIVIYTETNAIYINDLYPDDQADINVVHPVKKFSIENKSAIYAKYNLTMFISKNNFTSTNFKYQVSSTNGGYNADFTTAPNETKILKSEIVIPPHTLQNYTITFKLQGVGGRQNYDQGKTFAGYLQVDIVD